MYALQAESLFSSPGSGVFFAPQPWVKIKYGLSAESAE